MGEVARKADDRRIFTVEFKRGVVQQLVSAEKTLAELSRELDVQRAGAGAQADGDRDPAGRAGGRKKSPWLRSSSSGEAR